MAGVISVPKRICWEGGDVQVDLSGFSSCSRYCGTTSEIAFANAAAAKTVLSVVSSSES